MSEQFIRRRDALNQRLGETGALVLAAAPEVVVGRDTELRYSVDAELFYLTGYTEPEAVLVLVPSHKEFRFTLFVRPRDEARELWTGMRGGEEAARSEFGADAAYPISELTKRLPELLNNIDVLYARIGVGRPDLDAAIAQALSEARKSRPRTGRGVQTISDPGVLLDAMRVVKDEHEIAQIREAARITCESFMETLAGLRPEIGEWQVEANVDFGFRSRGGDGPAFPTIAAAGANATVLHYIENRAVARAGDLLLLDAGARYRMYCADMTRTAPVSGAFTDFQRAVYDVVLSAHAAAIKATRPGVSVDAPHQAAQRALAEGLIELKLLKGSLEEAIESPNGLRRYYPHRTSHWLGLDVHDAGAYATRDTAQLLSAGMVLTIEPGLYLKEQGIGIRIEDDALVTEEACEVLTSAVPTAAAEIEALVRIGG